MKHPYLTTALLLSTLAAGPVVARALQADEDADVELAAPAQPAADQVEATYLGVQCQPLDFDSADRLQVDRGTGLNVGLVAPESPAQAAGLRAGDVLLKLDDQVLINPAQLTVLIRTRDAGQAVTLRVLRDGEVIELAAELGSTQAPRLGPGGQMPQPQWRVLPAPGQPIEQAIPDDIRMELEELDLQTHMREIEQHIQRQQEEMLRFIEQIEGARLDARQHREQLRHELERQIEDHRDIARPGVQAQRNVMFNDGEHTIQATGNPDGWQTLKVTDQAGEILYDGDYPQTDEQWRQLPGPIRDKVKAMIENNPFQIEINPHLPPARPAEPEPDNEPPLA